MRNFSTKPLQTGSWNEETWQIPAVMKTMLCHQETYTKRTFRGSTGKTIGKCQQAKVGGPGKNKFPVRECRVCSTHKKRSETRYIYEFCVVPLHKGSCFEKYHTLKHYQAICILKTPSDTTMHKLNRETGVVNLKGLNSLQCVNNW